jgi:hypothetical protein
MTMKSRLPDSEKLKAISDDLCDNIEELLEFLDLEFVNTNKMITMSCPIHNGDNPSAINIYPEGEYSRGNWVCRTHHCEKHFKSSILGFIRGVLSNRNNNWRQDGDKFCSFLEAVNFALSFLQKDYSHIKVDKLKKNKKTFTSMVNYVNSYQKNPVEEQKITRDQVISKIKIPAQYFIDRDYSPEILTKYDVGLCDTKGKPMYDRVVVPIYDNEYTHLVGCTARSIYEKCSECKSYHNPKSDCPKEAYRHLYSKWKHSEDFKGENHLYNFWFSKKHIMKSTIAILVESPGNVWRLEENGIHNSVATFGAHLTDRQKIILDSSGAMNLVLLMDNDKAGIEATEQIIRKCKNTYRIFQPKISTNDVGEMNPEQIQKQIVNFIKDIV